MSIKILSNIPSLRALRNLELTNQSLTKSMNRLSSGYRITSAGDDAAGLAIADSLRLKSRVLDRALLNANDGISSLAIADGALGEVSSILSRMAELASQSANGTLSVTQRSSVASEFESLGSEIERIAATTAFNGIKLLSGSSQITLQIGDGSGSSSQIGYSTQLATLQGMGLGNAGGALTVSVNGDTDVLAMTAARAALDAVTAAINSLGSSRGILGAVESRLSSAITNIGVTRDNLLAAESRIRDVDVAEESATMTRLSILQQIGTAVVAQANQLPALALKLLG